MARTGLVQDERFQRHDTGPEHPERPERLAAIARALDERGLATQCIPVEFGPVDMELVRRNHDDAYLERLQRACGEGKPIIDVPDSAICPESFEIAQLATGAVIAAVDEVMAGRLDNAFCAVRPPGHHAERHMSMGFCLFNNIAIAARHLLEDHGLSRVLILDWDVHHGNGTQHTFEEDPRVLFVSLHGHPGIVYPGTGYPNERGKGPGEGYTMNFPMLPPSSDSEWQQAFQSRAGKEADGGRDEGTEGRRDEGEGSRDRGIKGSRRKNQSRAREEADAFPYPDRQGAGRSRDEGTKGRRDGEEGQGDRGPGGPGEGSRGAEPKRDLEEPAAGPILHAVDQFDPQFVLVSAGFDAHRLDPLAPLELSTEVYGWMTDRMIEVARKHCGGKLVSLLEGGYHLGALADCVCLHVSRLLVA